MRGIILASLTAILIIIPGCGEETARMDSTPAYARSAGTSLRPLSVPAQGPAVSEMGAFDGGQYGEDYSTASAGYTTDPGYVSSPVMTDGTYQMVQPVAQAYRTQPDTVVSNAPRRPSPYDPLFNYYANRSGGYTTYATAYTPTTYPATTGYATGDGATYYATSVTETPDYTAVTLASAPTTYSTATTTTTYTTAPTSFDALIIPTSSDPYSGTVYEGSPYTSVTLSRPVAATTPLPVPSPVYATTSTYPASPAYTTTTTTSYATTDPILVQQPGTDNMLAVITAPAVGASSYRLVPATDIPPGNHPNDAGPSQWYEILRPGNGPIRIGRVSSTCVCVGVRVPNRFVGAGERALIEARTLTRPPVRNLTYGIYVNIMDPDKVVLDADVTLP